MSDAEEPEVEVDAAEEPGESAGMSERTAKIVLLTVGLLAMWGIVAVLPETAYFVAGIMACRGWQKARGWIGRRGEDEASDPELEADETVARAAETWRVPTFHELCESLARVGTPHAHIAVLAHDLGTTPERVREALDACGVQVEAVRMQGRGSSTGVKGDALPTPRSSLGGVVGAGQPGNNDNNNSSATAPEKGLRVEPIGQAGSLIRNPADAVRHHQIRKQGGAMRQQTTEATLVIGDSNSYCARCKVPAFWEDTHHSRAAGGSQSQPCGARFTAMRHADGRGKEHILRTMRPDLPIA